MQTLGRSTPLNGYRRASRSRAVISLTPLIDVVFILLVFFMLASSFLDWRSITLYTAKAQSSTREVSEHRTVMVSVSATEVRLDGDVLTVDVLVKRIQQRLTKDPAVAVRIQPVGDTRLQAVISVLDQLQAAGITRLNMVRDRNWSPASAPGG